MRVWLSGRSQTGERFNQDMEMKATNYISTCDKFAGGHSWWLGKLMRVVASCQDTSKKFTLTLESGGESYLNGTRDSHYGRFCVGSARNLLQRNIDERIKRWKSIWIEGVMRNVGILRAWKIAWWNSKKEVYELFSEVVMKGWGTTGSWEMKNTCAPWWGLCSTSSCYDLDLVTWYDIQAAWDYSETIS